MFAFWYLLMYVKYLARVRVTYSDFIVIVEPCEALEETGIA